MRSDHDDADGIVEPIPCVALYKSLIAAHTAAQLEDDDGFALHLHDAIGDM